MYCRAVSSASAAAYAIAAASDRGCTVLVRQPPRHHESDPDQPFHAFAGLRHTALCCAMLLLASCTRPTGLFRAKLQQSTLSPLMLMATLSWDVRNFTSQAGISRHLQQSVLLSIVHAEPGILYVCSKFAHSVACLAMHVSLHDVYIV